MSNKSSSQAQTGGPEAREDQLGQRILIWGAHGPRGHGERLHGGCKRVEIASESVVIFTGSTAMKLWQEMVESGKRGSA